MCSTSLSVAQTHTRDIKVPREKRVIDLAMLWSNTDRAACRKSPYKVKHTYGSFTT